MHGETKRRRSVAAAIVPAMSLSLPRPASSSARQWLVANLPFLRLAAGPWPRQVSATAGSNRRLSMPWMAPTGFPWLFGLQSASHGAGIPPHIQGDATSPARPTAGLTPISKSPETLWLMPMVMLRASAGAMRSPGLDWRRAAPLATAAKISPALVPDDLRHPTPITRLGQPPQLPPTETRGVSQEPNSSLINLARALPDDGLEQAVPASDSKPEQNTSAPEPNTSAPEPHTFATEPHIPRPPAEHPTHAVPPDPVPADIRSIIALVQKKPLARTVGAIASTRPPVTSTGSPSSKAALWLGPPESGRGSVGSASEVPVIGHPLPSTSTEAIRAGTITNRGESGEDMAEDAILRREPRLLGLPLARRISDTGVADFANRSGAVPLPGRAVEPAAVVADGTGRSLAPPHPAVPGAEMLPSALPAFTIALDSLRTLVQREVKAAVAQYSEDTALPVVSEQKEEIVSTRPAEPMTDDRMARQLLRQFRQLAQEDRFRSGLVDGR